MIDAAIAWAGLAEQQQIRTLEKHVSDLVMDEARAMALVVSHEGKIETLQAQLTAARKALATAPLETSNAADTSDPETRS
jgi:predicted LPLAT superfamily acyltransferase